MKTFTQEEINEMTNILYMQYIKFLEADKMEYHEFAIIENVLIKIQMMADEKMNEDEK